MIKFVPLSRRITRPISVVMLLAWIAVMAVLVNRWYVEATGNLATDLARYGSAGALMTIVHVAKLGAFGFIGFAIGSFLPLMAAMIAAGAVGNWLGEVALHKTSEQRFRLVLQVILTLLALRLIWSAGTEAGWY